MLLGVHHAGITVADLDRSIKFYSDVLNAELVWRHDAIATEYARAVVGLPDARMNGALMSIPGGGSIELIKYDAPEGDVIRPRPCDTGSTHVAFVVDDVPSLFEQLLEAGVEVVSDSRSTRGGNSRGGLTLYARDPDGAFLEFMQLPPANAELDSKEKR